MKKHVCFKTILLFVLLVPAIAFQPAGTAWGKDDPAAPKSNTEKAGKSLTAEKRKALFEEAVAAINETKKALRLLDKEKNQEALAALEKASGKLTIILAREPELALAPADVDVLTTDILIDIEAVRDLREEIEEALDEGRIQQARHMIRNLASETVISVTKIPLETYPDAIKKAVRLIDEDKIEKARLTLQTALNTLVVTDTIIPLPVMQAKDMLKEAETLAEKADRSKEENKRLRDLLQNARRELEFAQALGYGSQEDCKNLFQQLDKIEKKAKGGRSGTGFFEKIKEYLQDAMESSQKKDNR